MDRFPDRTRCREHRSSLRCRAYEREVVPLHNFGVSVQLIRMRGTLVNQLI
jgi:hypothetical protein